MLPRPDERTFPRMPSTRVTTEKLKDRASLSFDESAVTSLCDDVQWHVQWHVQWQVQWQIQWQVQWQVQWQRQWQIQWQVQWRQVQ